MRIISTHPKRQLKDEDGNLREPYEPFKTSHGWAAAKMPSNTYLITVDDLKRQVLKGDRKNAQTIARRMELSESGNTNDIKARIIKALYQGNLSEKDELEARIAELESELEKAHSDEPVDEPEPADDEPVEYEQAYPGIDLDNLARHSLKELKPLGEELGVTYEGSKDDYVAALELVLEVEQ